MADNLDDLPPLEDMSAALGAIKLKRDIISSDIDRVTPKNTTKDLALDCNTSNSHKSVGNKSVARKVEVLKDPDGSELHYAKVAKDNHSSDPSKEEKKQEPAINKEISKALSQPLEETLLTPQALQSVFKDQDLLKAMMSPKIQQAIADMGADPAKAKLKYANDEEVATFFSKWMGTMKKTVPDFETRAVEQQRKRDKTLDVDSGKKSSMAANIVKNTSSDVDSSIKPESGNGTPNVPILTGSKIAVSAGADIREAKQQSSSENGDKSDGKVSFNISKQGNSSSNPRLIEVIDDNNSADPASTKNAASGSAAKNLISTASTSQAGAVNTQTPKFSGKTMQFGPNGREVPVEIVQYWMSNPVISRALNDPVTGQMLTALQQDPNVFPRLVQDPRIQILLRAGILEVPPKFR